MGCRPSIIAGTSMGALIGALYASGVPGRTIRENIERNIISRKDSWHDIFVKRADLLQVVRSVTLQRGPGGTTVKPDRFLNFLLTAVHKKTFEDLEIPLLVVTTDFWKCEEVVLKTGDLLPALKASFAIPGIFAPVTIGERVLLDGGIVNLVPYELVLDQCDISIAVNVAGTRTPGKSRTPSGLTAILGSFQIMQDATLAEKMKRRMPDIYVHPEVLDVPMFSFGLAARVLRQSAPAVTEMKSRIEQVLAR
jgi:NTE family protein